VGGVHPPSTGFGWGLLHSVTGGASFYQRRGGWCPPSRRAEWGPPSRADSGWRAAAAAGGQVDRVCGACV
jgi:hypothetical protein